jgi:hypothetical protein
MLISNKLLTFVIGGGICILIEKVMTEPVIIFLYSLNILNIFN